MNGIVRQQDHTGCSDVIRVKEVAARLNCSENKAYAIIRQLNAELHSKGYITMAGRVSRAYFEEKCYISKPGA